MLAIDTSTVVNVGLARGAQVLATATVEDRMAHVEQLTPAGPRLPGPGRPAAERGRSDRRRPRAGTVHGPAGRHRHRPDPGRGRRDPPARGLQPGCARGAVRGRPAGDRPTSWWPPTPAGGRSTGPRTPPTAAAKARLGSVRPWTCHAGPRSGPRPLSVSRPAGRRPRAAELSIAAVLATAGPALPDAGSTPLYLRRPDATEPTRRKSVLPSRRGPPAMMPPPGHDQHPAGPAGRPARDHAPGTGRLRAAGAVERAQLAGRAAGRATARS